MVLDTNIPISALISSRQPAIIYSAWEDGKLVSWPAQYISTSCERHYKSNNRRSYQAL